MKVVPSSFRDPSGYVYLADGKIIRSINRPYLDDWNAVNDSGFFAAEAVKKSLPDFRPISPPTPEAALGLEVEKLPFISYPYEWSFAQLKDAAGLTLELLSEALRHGIILKDASAYNVQFRGAEPVFIDLLSFEPYQEGRPWQAYRQFCMHFLAPLALMRYCGLWCGTLSKLKTDGVALDRARALLPFKARLKPSLWLHIFMHAAMEAKWADPRRAAQKVKSLHLSSKGLSNLIVSLKNAVSGLVPPATKTQWGDYYNDTNYSEKAFAHKKELVARAAGAAEKKDLAIDLGANTGFFTDLLAARFDLVIAPDIDPAAVDHHYRELGRPGARRNILPLVMDLSNPSPALGWACRERDSFPGRCRASMINALALIHHLVLADGIPFDRVAPLFADLLEPGGRLLLEFVPLEDSQVQRMTAARSDSLEFYNLGELRRAFQPYFSELDCLPIEDSRRSLLVFKKKTDLPEQP